MAVIFTGSEHNADPSVGIRLHQLTESLMYQLDQGRLFMVLDVIAENPADRSQELYLVVDKPSDAVLKQYHDHGDLTNVLNQLYEDRLDVSSDKIAFKPRRNVIGPLNDSIEAVRFDGTIKKCDNPTNLYGRYFIGDIPPMATVCFGIMIDSWIDSKDYFSIDGPHRAMDELEFGLLPEIGEEAVNHFHRYVRMNFIPALAHDIVIPKDRWTDLHIESHTAQIANYFQEYHPLQELAHWFAAQSPDYYLAATIVDSAKQTICPED